MKKTTLSGLTVLVTLSILFGCTEEKQSLIGSWSGFDAQNHHQTFIFHEDDSVTWIIAGAGTLQVKYRFDTATRPFQLDLLGFDTPPLKGRSLYGILAFDGSNSFRFDCEAGAADGPGENFRPVDFTEDVVVYTLNQSF